MRSQSVQPFSNALGVVHLGPSSIDIGLVYPMRCDLEHDYSALLAFHTSQQGRSGHQLRIERTKRGRRWLELSCWSRDYAETPPPTISMRLAKDTGDRPAIIKHLQLCNQIEIGFVSLEEEENIDKAIRRVESGIISLARGTAPILLWQMRILGRICRASLS